MSAIAYCIKRSYAPLSILSVIIYFCRIYEGNISNETECPDIISIRRELFS